MVAPDPSHLVELKHLDEAGVQLLGARLAAALEGHGAVLLHGDFGAGKTTLCRGILRALGHTGAVKSPTFTLVEPYEIDGRPVYHFDLYRLVDPGELDYVGVDEYFAAGGLCLIEWPEKAAGFLPAHDLEIFLEAGGAPPPDVGIDVCGETRNISIRAASAHGEKVCTALHRDYRSA